MPLSPALRGSALILLASLLASASASAQVESERRSAFSLLIGGGYATLFGSASEGGVFGLTAGVAHERPIREGLAWRTELLFESGGTDLGRTGTFSLPTTISQTHAGLSGQLRWSREQGRYLGAGATLLFSTTCDVDTEGGPGFLGGETVACEEFTDISFEEKSPTVGLLLAAGVQRPRLGLEMRFEQGLNSSVGSSSGPLTPRRFSVLLNYRLRARR